MNSFEEIKKENNGSNDQGSLAEQIEELERWNEFLANEFLAYRRRLYQDFEVMVCMAHILKKLEDAFGEFEVQKIVNDFMENEKTAALKEQHEMAKDGNWRWEFLDIESLFSKTDSGGGGGTSLIK